MIVCELVSNNPELDSIVEWNWSKGGLLAPQEMEKRLGMRKKIEKEVRKTRKRTEGQENVFETHWQQFHS